MRRQALCVRCPPYYPQDWLSGASRYPLVSLCHMPADLARDRCHGPPKFTSASSLTNRWILVQGRGTIPAA